MTTKDKLNEEALAYHEQVPAGKIFTGLKKSVATQHDLVLAYSPGVAAPCLAIHEDEDASFRYTGRGNLVGVVSNGTAVLGLGNIGPHAAKPVMEGKAMLFKKFADIDVFDIELKAEDTDAFVAAVQALEPTFGGINLEDIKAPECFEIEERLRESMTIPVFHDDQHGTAIIAGAAFLNALEVAGKQIGEVKVVFSGAGAAAIACANLFLSLGVRPEHLTLCDSKGVVHLGRADLNKYKQRFARETALRTLAEALAGADAFVGVSVAGAVSPDMVKAMAKSPIIFALANPDPEILPDAARAVRPDAIVATGRSDYPNQVNNVLGFPFIFRGALDVRATTVNEAMKLAAVRAIAALAKENVPDVVMRAYSESEVYQFGRDYLIPKPVDPRVLFHVAPAVAKAAMESGVARRQLDIDEYTRQIERILGPTQSMMRQLKREIATGHQRARRQPVVVLPHAYDRRVLRAAAQVADEGEVRLVLLGERPMVEELALKHGLPQLVSQVQVVNPRTDGRFSTYADKLFELRQRKGMTRTAADGIIDNPNYFAAMMLKTGAADGLVSGVVESYASSAQPLLEVVGTEAGHTLAGIYMVMHGQRQYFFADCTINIDPTAAMLADIAVTTAELARRYTKDKIHVALLSFASFGATRHPECKKVAEAVALVRQLAPGLEVDGEMQADVALSSELREREFPFCRLTGNANVMIFPDLASANLAYKLLANMSGASLIGPILAGMRQPANILQISATTDEVLNIIYVTAHQALARF